MSKTYKVTIRVPTDEYAYVEITLEDTPEAILSAYNEFKGVFKANVGLPTKEWNAVLDRYGKEGSMEADVFPTLGAAQAWMIHELDKMNARCRYVPLKDR